MNKLMWIGAFAIAGLVVTSYALKGAEEQTWNGIISDSMCLDDHGGEVDPKECTAKCVRNGDKYVLMVDYTRAVPIANQDFPDLAAHAGDTVKATGEMRDGGIVLTKLQ